MVISLGHLLQMKEMEKMKVFLLGLGLSVTGISAFAQGDSIGVKNIDGVRYVVHSVQKGDNLGKIAQKYHVEMAQIQKANGISGGDIKIGQELLVPKPLIRPTKMHTVEKGQTLYAVARQYKMEVGEVKTLNSLSSDELNIGQKLKVYTDGATASAALPEMAGGPASDPVVQVEQPKVEETKAAPAEEKAAPAGFHRVKAGETLYSIARDHACSVPELKKINKLDSENIAPGMELKLPGAGPVASTKPNVGYSDSERPTTHNGGSSLIDVIAKVAPDPDAAPTSKGDEFPELEILKAAPGTRIAPEAKQVKFTEKYSGKPYIKVEENGDAGPIEDLGTDQTKFYAFHKYLPKGSYLRVDFPDRDQSILVEVVNQLPANDPNIIRLSAKCRDYLMMRQPTGKVILRYVMPAE